MASGTGPNKTARVATLCSVAALGSLGFGAAVAAQGDDGLNVTAQVGNGQKGKGAAVAALHDTRGNRIGAARFLARPDGSLRIRVNVSGLAPGFHGFHVHATGQCVAPFATAGGHRQSGTQTHGAHAGDLPPLLVRGDGTAGARFETDALTLAQVLDADGDGSALIVHAGRDNLANIPARYHSDAAPASGPDATTLATGDSGARAACGVVKRARSRH